MNTANLLRADNYIEKMNNEEKIINSVRQGQTIEFCEKVIMAELDVSHYYRHDSSRSPKHPDIIQFNEEYLYKIQYGDERMSPYWRATAYWAFINGMHLELNEYRRTVKFSAKT